MSAEQRYVFDASVLISAALFGQSIPRQAVRAAVRHGVLLLSQVIIDELEDVFSRAKFDRYVGPTTRKEFLERLLADATILDPLELVQACRDPRDDKYLSLAVSAQASCLITGDQDLLVLHPFRGIPIVTPAQFLAEFLAHLGNGQQPPDQPKPD